MTESILLILLSLGLVLLNAFFVLAEFSLVKIRASRVLYIKQSQLYGFRGRIMFRVHQHLDVYLSACQLGITLASLGLGWIGEPAFAHLLQPLFVHFHITSIEMIEIISFGVAFSVITFLHIVVGELMPKTLAIRRSEAAAVFSALPLFIFYGLMTPFIWILNTSANGLLKLFHLSAQHDHELSYSRDEIKLILKGSHSHHQFNQGHRDMLIKMLDFYGLQAVDVMRPINEMIALQAADNFSKQLEIIKQNKFSRYPVRQSTEIIGILHVKDLFLKADINTLPPLRPVIKISKTDKAIQILEQFQSGLGHFAIVYDEEKPIGFIAQDNLLYVLMGKMQDEFHLTDAPWIVLSDNEFLMKGTSSVYVLEQLLEKDFSVYPVDTIAGLLLEVFRSVPKEGDEWQQPEFTLKVTKMKGPKIIEVKVIKKQTG